MRARANRFACRYSRTAFSRSLAASRQLASRARNRSQLDRARCAHVGMLDANNTVAASADSPARKADDAIRDDYSIPQLAGACTCSFRVPRAILRPSRQQPDLLRGVSDAAARIR